MPHDVIMPQMGESIAEGTITTWLKAIGDTVDRDEPLFEMSTDKVDAEIPSPVTGTLLEIKVQPGETVPINTIVAVIGGEGESAQPSAPAAAAPAGGGNGSSASVAASSASSAPASAAPSSGGAVASAEERRRTKSSPVVRKIAAKHGIDISQLTGSGISGRVTKADIMAYVDGGSSAPSAAPTSTAVVPVSSPSPGAMMPAPMQSHGPIDIPDAYRPKIYDGDKVEELTRMRSLIADHMVLSKRISPHVQTVWEFDFSRVAKLRKQYKAAWKERHDTNLTYTSFVMKATVDALKAFPVINASLDGNRIIYHQNVNLGMAVALDWGLIVPVIKGADDLNLLGLTRRLNDLGTRARDKKLKPDEVADGTFTITNPGVFGNLFGIPVINQPQVAILGCGGIEKRPVVVDDMIAIRTRAYMSLSFDHRLVDGAVADQFMAKLRKHIEEFDEADLS